MNCQSVYKKNYHETEEAEIKQQNVAIDDLI